jgi:hypothetical protein
MIIEEGKISMDTVKLRGIRDWPVSTMLKQTQSFLNLGTFTKSSFPTTLN